MAAVFIVVLSFISVFLTPATSQQDIVSVRTIEDGRPFTITCNSQRVITAQANLITIYKLEIDIWNNGAEKYKMLAQYNTHGPPGAEKEKQVPLDGRKWQFSFSGSNTETGGANNQASMKIEVLMPTGKCEDAGMYKCIMEYYSAGAMVTVFSEQNVTSTATTTEPLVVLDPIIDAPSGVTNTSTYDVGQNVTVKCRFEGPETLSIKWRRERRPAIGNDIQYDDYPFANDIATDTPTKVPGTSATCPTYSHRSVLELTISSEDKDRQYQCVVVSGDEVRASSAVLIQLNEAVVTKHEDIVSVTTVEDGRPFLITCNAQRLVPLPTGTSTIQKLQIDVCNKAAQGCRAVAEYLTDGPPGAVKEIQNPPLGRHWEFSFSGSNTQNQGFINLFTMKIEILVPTGTCDDAGTYRCSMFYYLQSGTGLMSASVEQNVTSTAKTVSPIVILNPAHNDLAVISNASPYRLGDNITATCTYQGTEDVELKWKRERRPALGGDIQYEDYPTAQDIIISPPTQVAFISGTCRKYIHASVLHLTVSGDDRNRKYLCVVISGGLEVASVDALVDMVQC